MDLPNVRFVELVDNETGRRITLDTSSAAFREAYHRHAVQSDEARQAMFRRLNADAIELMTGQSYVEPLTKFFRARERKG